ncbi:MAG: hypothetical protein WCE69_14960 [Aestuariivirga sp.]
MINSTFHNTDLQLSAPKFDHFGLLLKFFAKGIRDMNRYRDAATFVHPAGRPETETSREQSWEGPL